MLQCDDSPHNGNEWTKLKAKVYIIFVYLASVILFVESAKKRKRPDMYHAVGSNSKNQHRQG
ncbi:hypothetical protein GQX74_004113 [Glossina fuscipes]|nr:hypothetical protein GQX74_004113 [Glossina fuscipes]